MNILGSSWRRFPSVIVIFILGTWTANAQQAVESPPAGTVKASPAKAYTIERFTEHTKRVAQSPYVFPTASSDENLSIGKSHGWPAKNIPRHDIIAYKITDPKATGPKTRVILASGNHNTEYTGSWSLEGALDFLISDEPEAVALRKVAEFYVYPMVNPDGRFTRSGRSNPEMASQGVVDHNRAWLTSGKFSTIDTVKAAMKKDTGGAAEYLLDFHSADSNHFRIQKELLESPMTKAMALRDISVKARVSLGDPGMLRNWSMGREGLRVPNALTPEHANNISAEASRRIGRNYMLALYDLIAAKPESKPAKQPAESAK